ncbi:hypothetical protein WR25_20231 [Diploscapter pachys]|uniref:Uncharacterized protein n=1 Tax=Diploscapter pachys TaxID=2018661 RepID=A0A2A2M5R4_9BILA|nr:hypothetical protein WR25_20231 [Diploscapter pachys]
MAVHGLFHHAIRRTAQQFGLRLLVVADAHIQRIDALTRQGSHALAFDFGQGADLDRHRLARGARQVFHQAGLQLGHRGEHGLVQRVEVQLEGLGLDDIRRVARNGELADGHHRLARG